jgi:hypothetical protein
MINNNFLLGFEKTAFDGDYEEGGKYYMMANRSGPLGIDGDIVGKLRKVIKKGKDLDVIVSSPDGEFRGKKALKLLDQIEDEVKQYHNGEAYDPKKHTDKMNWHRDYAWAIGMDKKKMGKKTETYEYMKEVDVPNKDRGFFDKLFGLNKTKKEKKLVKETESYYDTDKMRKRVKQALGQNFNSGFQKAANYGRKGNNPFGKAFSDKKDNKSQVKVPSGTTNVTAVKPGIQHTSGYR